LEPYILVTAKSTKKGVFDRIYRIYKIMKDKTKLIVAVKTKAGALKRQRLKFVFSSVNPVDPVNPV